MNEPLQVGTIRRAHGVRGLLRVEPTTDQPETRFAAGSELGVGETHFEIVQSQPLPGGDWLIGLSGITSRTEAEGLRGQELWVERGGEALGELRDDLVGYSVVASDGSALGEVVSVEETGSNDVCLARGPEREFFIPLIASLGIEIDAQNRRITVPEIEGLLE